MHREIIRKELVKQAGSAKEAFRRLDNNNSGHISLQDFADGVSRLGVNWQEITGFRKPQDLFRLFDLGKDSVVDFNELFPQDDPKVVENTRLSTPEFWTRWIRQNRDLDEEEKSGPSNKQRGPRWQPSTSEEELRLLFDASQSREEVADKRRWMSATIRRLKHRGKSDARCREVVALHLPRGSGPKDREDVQTFSEAEVKACKKSYMDKVTDPVKNIQKVVGDMHDQRKELQHARHQLWTLTMEPIMRQRAEEERKNAVTSILTGGGHLLDKVKDRSNKDDDEPPVVKQEECPKCSGLGGDGSPVSVTKSAASRSLASHCPVCGKPAKAPRQHHHDKPHQGSPGHGHHQGSPGHGHHQGSPGHEHHAGGHRRLSRNVTASTASEALRKMQAGET
jgi:hypothetical protein